MKKFHKNNQGYTLVELLVTVAILLIITLPLLNGFVVSARVNAKAKRTLRATTAGANIMETIKSHSLEELEAMTYTFEKPDGTIETKSIVEYDDTNNLYNLTFVNQNVDGKDFRAEVVLNPNIYNSTNTEVAASVLYNDIALTELYDMNSECNAFIIQSVSMDSDSANALGLDSTKYDQISRKISVNITASGDQASVYSSITYSGNSKTVYGLTNQCVYMDSSEEGELKNVYVIYEPSYSSSDNNNHMNETIEICNTSNYPVNVFLIKQKNSSTTALKEAGYTVDVNVKEGTRSDYKDENGQFNVITKIRTNIDESKMGIKYFNGSAFSPSISIGAETVSAKNIVGLSDLVSGEVSERIYQVTIKVYEQDDETNEMLYEMEGTKTE